MIPGPDNFSIDQFAPDLSKTYSLYFSSLDMMDMHLRQRTAPIRISNMNTKGKDVNILVVWMMIWILAFEYLDDIEKQFRVEQMLGIMHRMFMKHHISQKEFILQDVFETVLDHGTFKMIEELYEYLNLCKIQSNAFLDNIFFNAIRKHNEILELIQPDEDTKSADPFENCNELEINQDYVEADSNSWIISGSKSGEFGSIGSPGAKQTLSISPLLHKEIEFADKRSRLKRYLESINLTSKYYLENKLKFRKRTFKHDKDINNHLIQDTLTIYLDHEWESWGKNLRYQEIISSYKTSGFYWISWKEDILPSLCALIGFSTGWADYGYWDVLEEHHLFITEKELRSVVNGLYETIQSQKNEKMFDIMIFREIRGQVFWNWLFYFIHYGLPYDWLLPYWPNEIQETENDFSICIDDQFDDDE